MHEDFAVRVRTRSHCGTTRKDFTDTGPAEHRATKALSVAEPSPCASLRWCPGPRLGRTGETMHIGALGRASEQGIVRRCLLLRFYGHVTASRRPDGGIRALVSVPGSGTRVLVSVPGIGIRSLASVPEVLVSVPGRTRVSASVSVPGSGIQGSRLAQILFSLCEYSARQPWAGLRRTRDRFSMTN